jgi:putative hemolysin
VDSLQFKNFIVRVAETPAEIEAAQRLRYRVFYEEMSAAPTPEMKARRLDFDGFDARCDHLLVIDSDLANGSPGVVGTYRLLRRTVAMEHGGFYSEQEYNLDALLHYPHEIVELGRSCVDSAYRSRGVMQMLWRGLAAYVLRYDIRVMFGCASFPGTDPKEMGAALSYLHHYHLAPQTLRPRALPQHYVGMEMLPRSGIDEQAVLSDLPPLIKGYLRVGGFVGDGAVVDRQFNTTDVCVIVTTDELTQKYARRYRASASETAENRKS